MLSLLLHYADGVFEFAFASDSALPVQFTIRGDIMMEGK
mgnify:CR=1 FL=1